MSDAAGIGSRDGYLAVIATARADGTIQSSVVNAGVLADPRTGEDVVAFVTYGKAKLALARQLLGAAAPVLLLPLSYRDYYQKLTGVSLSDCPVCHQGHMVPVRTLPPTGRPPPKGEPR